MSNIIDLCGKKFGRLTVISRAENNKENRTFWLCRCDCGTEKIIAGAYLRRGTTKSCGCLSKEIKEQKLINLTGMKFGRWTVIKRAEDIVTKGGSIKTAWLCKCECGNESEINGLTLRNGESTSCGCYRIEINRKEFGESAFNRLVAQYKNNAKIRKIEFNLSDIFIKKITKENCYYCNSEPHQTMETSSNGRGYGSYVYNGIDRINSSKGYTEDNVVSCCGTCNTAKMAMTKEEFLLLIERIYNNRIRK